MEGLMIAMADCPEAVLALYDFVADDMIQLLRWQEETASCARITVTTTRARAATA